MKHGSRGLHLSYEALYRRYMAGESGVEIAREIGIDPGGLYMSWRRRGLPMRSRSEAKRLEFKRYPQRKVTAPLAMQEARRGAVDPLPRREQRARTREERMLGTSRLEDELAAYLDRLGVAYIRQKAIGPYNVDFALPDTGLVIEVDGGGHNPRVRANRFKRQALIEAQGWYVINLRLRRGLAGLAVGEDDQSRLMSALRLAARRVKRPIVL